MTYRPLILWLLCYATAWTLLTYLLDPTVPYDAVEALNWGTNAEWGSPKNPWLVGAMMQPVVWLPWLSVPLYWYAVHFMAIAIGMLGVWLLALRLGGSRRLAWLALLTLNVSGIINIDIIPYNDNYLLVMLWVAPLRRCYRQPPFYLALAIGLALVLPNALWLWQHDWVAFRWVDSQIKRQLNPGILLTLLLVFYPVSLLWLMLRRAGAVLSWPDEMAMRALLWIYLLPLCAIIVWFSFNVGGRLTEWLQPWLILAPPLLVGCVRQPPSGSLRAAMLGLGCAALVVYLGYAAVMLANVRNAGQKMVGIKAFSLEVEQRWRQRYHSELRYVGGDYLSQWLTVYADSRPQIVTRWTLATRPNIYNADLSATQIARHGVALMGRLGERCAQSRFNGALDSWPQLRIDWQQELPFQADPHAERQTLCVAFVRPQPR